MKITIESADNGYILDNGMDIFEFTDFEDMLAEIRRMMEVEK